MMAEAVTLGAVAAEVLAEVDQRGIAAADRFAIAPREVVVPEVKVPAVLAVAVAAARRPVVRKRL